METKIPNRYQERLTADNAALLLVDHQVGLFTGVRDISVAELTHNVVALAKAAKVLGVPTIVTATSPEMWGPIIPELTEALSGSSCDPCDWPRLRCIWRDRRVRHLQRNQASNRSAAHGSGGRDRYRLCYRRSGNA